MKRTGYVSKITNQNGLKILNSTVETETEYSSRKNTGRKGRGT